MCTGHDGTACPQEMAQLASRRGFLRTAAATAALVGAGGALAGPARAGEPEDEDEEHNERHGRVPVKDISIQLYTLRDQLAADVHGTIGALQEIGYTRVETAGFAGLSAAEFKEVLDEHDIWASSNHIAIPQPFDAAAWRASLADARTLRSHYIVHPVFGIDFATGEVVRDKATWQAFARDLDKAGRMARRAGLRLGYHNHNWEFFRLTDDPSMTGFDVLVEETDPRLVHFELDLFWAWRGARDPVDVLSQCRHRVRQFHVKDLNLAGSFEDPGEGLIDFVRIFQRSRGVEEFIVERDDAGTDPREPADALDTAAVGYRFLRRVRF